MKLSFKELINYGLGVSNNIVDDMPWSFELGCFSFSHEDNETYIVSSYDQMYHMKKGQTIILDFVDETIEFVR